MRRGATAAFALLLVIAATVAGTGAVAASPNGMVGVPDAAISSNVPDHAKDKMPDAAAFRGDVMTTAGASTMAVEVTTEAAARGRSIACGRQDKRPACRNPQLALVLSDNTTHKGRDIALPRSTVVDALGFEPGLAHVQHSSGTTYSVPVEKQGQMLVFHIRNFSTNTITFSGTVSLTGNPAADGASYQYDLSDTDAVSNFNISVTGSTATEWDNQSAAGLTSGQSMSLSIAGNAAPSGPSANGEPIAVITGTETTSSWSASATGASNGATKGVTVPGNVDPDNESVTFTGVEQTNARTVSQASVSNGGTFSYSVGGNVPAESASVTFTGNSQTTPNDQSATGVAPGAATSFTTNGNLDPTGPSSNGNPELTVTAHTVNKTNYDGVKDDEDDMAYKHAGTDVLLDNPPEKITKLRFLVGTTNDPSGWTKFWIKTGEGPDTNHGEGTYVGNLSWTGDTVHWETLTLDSPIDTNGQDATLEMRTDQSSSYLYVYEDTDYGTCAFIRGGGSCENHMPAISMISEPGSVSASADDGTSASLGTMSDGQTITTEFDISNTANSLTIDSGTGGAFDWTIDKNDRTATENPSIDVDGDGATDYSYSGILTSGETASSSVSNLATGSHTTSVSLAGGTVDADISFTEITATDDPGVDLDGDGTVDASYSGILRSGETVSRSGEALTQGSTTLETSLTAGAVDYTLSATARTHTEDPTIDLGDDGSIDASHTGILSPGETATNEIAGLDTTTTTASIGLSAGEADVVLKFKERTQSANPSIEVNGYVTSQSGTLSEGSSASLTTDPAWIQNGTNRINVSVSTSVSADAPTGQVGLDYEHESATNQSVAYDAERWSERYNVSKTFASDQSNAQLTIPFEGTVLEIRSVEKRINGGSWSTISSGSYTLDGTTLTANLGSVTAGDTVEVRATGSKVKVSNGNITVLKPTTTGSTLDSRVRLDDWQAGSSILLPDSGDWNRLAYTYNESYSGADEYLIAEADGDRSLYMPNAGSGSEVRVSTIPVQASPVTGKVHLEVDSPTTTEPTFVVEAGQFAGDTVEYTYIGAKDDTKYVLYSQTHEIVRASGTASSPLTLEDDDSPETLQFMVDDGSVTSSDGGGGGGVVAAVGPVAASAASPLNSIPVTVLAFAGALVILYYVDRRLGSSASFTIPVVDRTISLPGAGWLFWFGAPATGLLILEYLSSGKVSSTLTDLLSRLETIVPLAGIAVVGLAGWWFYRKFIKGQRPRPIQIIRGGRK